MSSLKVNPFTVTSSISIKPPSPRPPLHPNRSRSNSPTDLSKPSKLHLRSPPKTVSPDPKPAPILTLTEKLLLPPAPNTRLTGDLARWPLPPPPPSSLPQFTGKENTLIRIKNLAPTRDHLALTSFGPLPLMPVHVAWLLRCATSYGFNSTSEAIRHLIFYANGETTAKKRLIFRIKRCLHCHVGAPANLHAKQSLPDTTYVYKFQKDWIDTVVEKCSVKSSHKAIRIICDYYMSRTEQARIESGDAAANEVETALFTAKREHDSRVKVAADRMAGSEEKGVVQILDDDMAEDPGACSAEATLAAISHCQVGRCSATLAEAMKETAEETHVRRMREKEKEDTPEMREIRKIICKTLGSVMG